MNHYNKLKSLNLPKGKYAIFGSGPMAIRGIRVSDDVDIVVKQDLWDELAGKYSDFLHKNPDCIRIDNLEIFRDWPEIFGRINEIIDGAEIIEELPFVQLKYVVEWKSKFGREKDKRDVELIKKYIEKQK